MFENSIFKIEFSILLGFFPHRNFYRLIFQSFVLREYSGVARDFPGGRLAHPEGQNEDENEKCLRKNK